MKRHGDRKAYLREKGKNNLQWSGRVGDRDATAAAASQQQPPQHHEVAASQVASQQQQGWVGTPLSNPFTPSSSASPPNTARSLVGGGSSEQNRGGNKRSRLVPVGEHHEGSFGVYMAHKMDKLRHQVDGAVARLEGPEGGVFKGVVAYINGYTTVPVATLRELLASRGGVVEAYNTPRCTHMICEALPYAKIRELRKLLHPPTVVRSAWVEASAQAGRKLPISEYMVDGVFVQKRTLAASFAAAAKSPKPRPLKNAGKSTDGLPHSSSSSGSSSNRGRASGGDGLPPPSVAAGRQHKRSMSAAGVCGKGKATSTGGTSGAASLGSGQSSRGYGPCTGLSTSSLDCARPGEASVASVHVGPRSSGVVGSTSLAARSVTRTVVASSIMPPSMASPLSRVVGSGTGIEEGGKDSGNILEGKEATERGQVSPAGVGGEHRRLKPDGVDVGSGYLELPGMGAAGEGGRSTKDDPRFMETFFKNSRLHFIGVGRAHAVKVVNAGLAARTRPGGVQPVFAGPLGRGDTRVILHVDMDCFFVSVLLKNRPELNNRPVAVAHNASNAKGAGSSEVSSCNYPARAKGLKAGMFMMKAKELCPELIVLRYDFEAYSEASDKMYAVFLRYAPVVMAVSCDEAFLELAKGTDPMGAATEIRRSILKETECPASAGASSNMLLARMATKEAKPNGQFLLPPEVAMHHMGPLPVQDLPGVGWKLRRRLNKEGLNVCSDLWPLSAARLQKGLGLGEKTGQALWEACRGIDKRPVQAPPDRKSIGAEVNYGVRFDTQAQADGFLSKLAVELGSRMHAEGVVGRALTLKVMKQRDGVGLPRKYLGHGVCDARSKLLNLRRFTADSGTLTTHALQLLKECKVPPDKIRGIGLQMTRLSPTADTGGGGGGGGGGGSSGGSGGGVASKDGGALSAWLSKAGEEEEEEKEDSDPSAHREHTRSSRVTGQKKGAAFLPQESRSNAPPRDNNNSSHDARSAADTAGAEAAAAAALQTVSPTARLKCRLPHEAGDNKRAREGEGGGATADDAPPPPVRHRGDGPERGTAIVGGTGVGDGAAAAVTRLSRATTADSGDSESGGSDPEKEVAEEVDITPVATTADVSVDTSPAAVVVVGGRAALESPAALLQPPPPPFRESRSDGGVDGVAVGGLGSPASVRRRRTPAGSPESCVTPSSGVHRVEGTPSFGVMDSPSMSQITFSQIDSTVLGALPPDLRQEVTAQLEARQRQKQGHDNAISSSKPPAMMNRAGAGGGEETARVSHCYSAGSTLKEVSAASRRTEATGGMASAEVVREGFDLSVKEGSSKLQQVNLDSLWTLRNMREHEDDENNDDEVEGAAFAVFDRESLRAMPLGLRLHYASLTENQRLQIARQYAHYKPGDGAAAGGDRGNASAVNRAAGAGVSPSSPALVSWADSDDRDGGQRRHSTSPRRARPSPAASSSGGGVFLSSSRGGYEGTPAASGLAASGLASFCEPQLDSVSLSQVDRDVLDCLPSDVREEVLRTIASNGGGGDNADVGVGATRDRDSDHHHRSGDGAADGTPADRQALADDERDAPEFVDLRSPSSPTPRSQSQRGDGRSGEEAGELLTLGVMFEAERAETLRGAMREWVGGAVRCPSQWHLELLYRYLEELVEDGRLSDAATFLRSLGRLSSKADQDAPDTDNREVDGGGGWRTGYTAVLAAVQELVRKRNGGASLALFF